MPNFENSISVRAPKQSVFDYVSKVENMPHYLPTVIEASMEGEDRVRMKVEIDGKEHEDSGFFRVSNDSRLEWGSEDHDYNGSMDFTEEGDETNVTMQLHINPPPQMQAEMDGKSQGDWTARIDESLTSALKQIKSRVEGNGASSTDSTR